MKPSEPKIRQLLTASTIALAFFCGGYLTPHSLPALAQAPDPTPSLDDVPGGGRGGGAAMVTSAGASRAVLQTASKSGWICAKGVHCMVTFAFRTSPHGAAKPKPFSCAGMSNCFAFSYTEPGYTYSTVDPYSGENRETVQNVQIAGMFQLQPSTK